MTSAFFFFNDTATTEIYTLSLHDALPISGPMIPLYTVGHRMIAHYPLVPIGWEMGIGCGVTSYDQKLYFGLIADTRAASDVVRLKEFLDQSFVELRSAAGVTRPETTEGSHGHPDARPPGPRAAAPPENPADAAGAPS